MREAKKLFPDPVDTSTLQGKCRDVNYQCIVPTCVCLLLIKLLFSWFEGQGVESFDIDLPNKTVSVTSTLPADAVLEIIKKTGKTTTLIGG